jgi:DNA polymerase-3 subunit gamma/tau
MSYTVLARKYRPQRFSEVIGQEHVSRTLKHALEQGRIAQGYIFSGHRGIGKTTVARILAMALNCRSSERPLPEPCGVCDSCIEIRESRSVDVIEIDAATNRGIDEIRDLREAARYRPARDRYKIYILDEAHQITDAAFNALLKTLEEPPGHVVFMMATTQPEDIPATIRSRCQHFSFHAVKFEAIVSQLRAVAEQEHIVADDEALALLAEAGDGSMRDALSILDQAIACCGQQVQGETVRQLIGAVPSEMLEQMLVAVQRNSSEEVLRLVDRLVTEGQNPVPFARQMVRFLRNVLVAKVAGTASPLLQISADERARAGRVAEQFSEEDLTRFLQIQLRTHSDLAYKQEPRFHLELGLLKMVHAQRLLPIEEFLSGAGLTAAKGPGGAAGNPHPSGEKPPVMRAVGQARTAESPFSVDSARKGTPRADISASPYSGMTSAAAAPAVEPASMAPELSETQMAESIISAAERAGYNDLANMLHHGKFSSRGNEVVVEVPDSAVLVRMALKKEAEQVLNAAATAARGSPARVKVVPDSGGQPGSPAVSNHNGAPARPAVSRPDNGPARARLADEPVIRRLQEKFGAEIRSVIDYREQD